MGYKRMKAEDVYEIFRRYHGGQKISQIAAAEERQRKTVRYYLKKLKGMGFRKEREFPDKEELYKAISKILTKRERKKNAYSELDGLEEKLKVLIQDTCEPVFPKTAFEIVKELNNLTCSYTTFKRFVKDKKILKEKQKDIIRIELPPAEEMQIDYGKMGMLYENKCKHKKNVYALITVLSHCRLPFIQFVYKQDQISFTGSVIDSFEYYEGVPVRVSIDNLKSGVIKPDLYDPKLNRTFADMAEYYKTFIDPCRVGKWSDKGKVERVVPMARQLFRKLKHLHPEANLNELNKYALTWCREEYGMKDHGTTNLKPFQVFQTIEKEKLIKLPSDRFVIPEWKKVIVHPDRFIQVDKKRYALPKQYIGHQLWAKKVENMVYVYEDYQLIRQYTVPKKHFTYYPGDFPEVKREMMEGGYPKYLLGQAKLFGESAYQLIEQILTPHAYLTARRAQGVLQVMKEYQRKTYFDLICKKAYRMKVNNPKSFRQMMEQERVQMKFDFESISTSDLGKEMTRGTSYYFSGTNP